MSDQQSSISIKQLSAIAIVLFACSGIATFIDVQVAQNRFTEFIPGDLRRIVQLSEIFAHGFGIALIMYLLWALAPAKRRLIPRLAACAILPGLAVQLVKLFVVRLRPLHFAADYPVIHPKAWAGFLPVGELNFEYASQSFPSAHAATAVGLAVGLIWLMPSCRYLFASLAFLAAVQRVAAGAHWVSDVFAGTAIAVIVCGFVFHNPRLNSLLALIESPKPFGEQQKLSCVWLVRIEVSRRKFKKRPDF